MDRARDVLGRKVTFYCSDVGGGMYSEHADHEGNVTKGEDNHCYIDEIHCWVEESRLGPITQP